VNPSSDSTLDLSHSPIAQLCFVTDDLEESVAAFAALTGLRPSAVRIAANAETPTTYLGELRQVQARTCAFRLPNIDVEFLEPGIGPSAWRDTLDRHGRALHHIAFRCADLSVMTERLSDLGFAVRQAADFVGGGGAYTVLDTARAVGAMTELYEVR